MIPGKLIKPAGWPFTSGDAAIRQIRCAGPSFDVIDPVFRLGVFTTHPGVQAGPRHFGSLCWLRNAPHPTSIVMKEM